MQQVWRDYKHRCRLYAENIDRRTGYYRDFALDKIILIDDFSTCFIIVYDYSTYAGDVPTSFMLSTLVSRRYYGGACIKRRRARALKERA